MDRLVPETYAEMLHVAEPIVLQTAATWPGTTPHTSFPFDATMLEPSPIMKALALVKRAINRVPVESGIVPARLLLVSLMADRLPALHVRP